MTATKVLTRLLLASTAAPMAWLLSNGAGMAGGRDAATPLIFAQAAPTETAPGTEGADRPRRGRSEGAGERQPGERQRGAQGGATEEPARPRREQGQQAPGGRGTESAAPTRSETAPTERAPGRASPATRDTESPTPRQGSAPAVETPATRQGSTPGAERPATRQSAPTVETPGARQGSSPAVETPATRQGSTPGVERPATRQSAPTVETPATRQGSSPAIETPTTRQGSSPAVETPAPRPGSAPTRQSAPAVETPATRQGTPTVETPAPRQGAAPATRDPTVQPAQPGATARPAQSAPTETAPAPTAPTAQPTQPDTRTRPAQTAPTTAPAPTAQPAQPSAAPPVAQPGTQQGQTFGGGRADERLAPGVARDGREVRIDELRGMRRERREGDRIIIEEPDRRIIRQGDRTVIIHDETQRFRESYRDADIRTERRGSEEVTVVRRPNGVEIVTVRDADGRLLRRVRREPGNREVVLIENAPRDRPRTTVIEEVVELPPAQVRIPREKYVVEVERASQEDLVEAFTAPPVERVERRYTLDQVRQSQALRERVRRVDVDTVTFEFGSWQLAPDQVGALTGVANAIKQALARNPNEVFLIEGHTDAVGPDVDNLTLSDRRAETVATILSERFAIPAENLTTQGYGEQYLKVNTQAPSRENRRVTMRRITPLLNGGSG